MFCSKFQGLLVRLQERDHLRNCAELKHHGQQMTAFRGVQFFDTQSVVVPSMRETSVVSWVTTMCQGYSLTRARGIHLIIDRVCKVRSPR